MRRRDLLVAAAGFGLTRPLAAVAQEGPTDEEAAALAEKALAVIVDAVGYGDCVLVALLFPAVVSLSRRGEAEGEARSCPDAIRYLGTPEFADKLAQWVGLFRTSVGQPPHQPRDVPDMLARIPTPEDKGCPLLIRWLCGLF